MRAHGAPGAAPRPPPYRIGIFHIILYKKQYFFEKYEKTTKINENSTI